MLRFSLSEYQYFLGVCRFFGQPIGETVLIWSETAAMTCVSVAISSVIPAVSSVSAQI